MSAAVAETCDPSFAGTFRSAPDVAAGEGQRQGFGGLTPERIDALLAVFNAASWPTSFSSELEASAPAPLPVDAGEPAGVRLSAGYGREALVATTGDTPELVALYPSFRDRERYWFRLDSVDLAPDRLQMRANGELVSAPKGDALGTMLSWYVLDPVEVRALLRRGRSYRIGLTGLCYLCGIAQNQVFEEAVTPELRRKWTESGIPDLVERAAGDSYTLDLSVLKTLASGGLNGDARPDDVLFRGRVRSAMKLEAPVADCAGWRLVVEVLEWDARRSLYVTLIVTERAWRSDVPPRRGQFVEGWAWMQGIVEAVIPASDETAAAV